MLVRSKGKKPVIKCSNAECKYKEPIPEQESDERKDIEMEGTE
jgi:hypothetical protein